MSKTHESELGNRDDYEWRPRAHILSRLQYVPRDRKLMQVDRGIASQADRKMLRPRAFLAV